MVLSMTKFHHLPPLLMEGDGSRWCDRETRWPHSEGVRLGRIKLESSRREKKNGRRTRTITEMPAIF